MLFLLNFNQRIMKKIYQFPQNINQQTVFHNDNNKKCLLSIKFIRMHIVMISEDHVTLKTRSNDAENTALITGINYI